MGNMIHKMVKALQYGMVGGSANSFCCSRRRGSAVELSSGTFSPGQARKARIGTKANFMCSTGVVGSKLPCALLCAVP